MTRAGLAAALVLAVLAAAAGGAAADVVARARLDQTATRVGEAADLAIEVVGAQNVPAPALPNVQGLGIRYVGPTTQFTIVNGASNTSITHHFAVTPLRAGTFVLGPIRVEHDGRTLDAGTVTLEALPPGSTGNAAGGARGEQLRLALSAPRTTVYLHERVPVTVRLEVGDVQVAEVEYPAVPGDGFSLGRFAAPAQRREQLADGSFEIAEFTTTLTPLRSGSLEVGPATLDLSTVTRRTRRGRDPFFDSFFGNATRQPVTLRSQPLPLTVLPLPEANRPPDFSGAVGSFEIEASANPRTVAAGDPVTITTVIRGVGNLDGLTPPALAERPDLRVYPVQQPPVPSPVPGAVPGARAVERRFEQVVIPSAGGAITLPDIRLAYFDPEAGAYRVASAAPIVLEVQGSAAPAAAPRIVGGEPAAPTRAAPLGRDIVFIKEAPGTLLPIDTPWWRGPVFWALQPLPLLVWLGVVAWDRRRRRLSSDSGYARFTRAGATARRALKEAEEALQGGDPAVFDDRVASAVRAYVAAKLDLPPGAVDGDTVRSRLAALGVPAEVRDEVHDLLATCEQVRFAPGAANDADRRRTLARAVDAVRALERERRVAPPTALALALALGTAAAAYGVAAADAPVAAPPAAPAPAAVPAGPPEDAPAALFFRGNALYAEGRYAEAAAAYEGVLARGVASPAVYFNLGNAELKKGDVGRAILAYERAERLAPGDPDLEANLRFARESARVDDDAPPLALRLAFPLAERVATRTLLVWASLLYAALMAALAARRLAPGAARPLRVAALGLALAFAVAASSAFARLATVDLAARAVVVAAEPVPVRFEPSEGGTMHYEVRPGTVLTLLGERDGWAQVARADGTRGWIAASAIARR